MIQRWGRRGGRGAALRRGVRLAAGLILLAGLTACRRKDIRTVRILLPDLRTERCAELAATAARNVPGVLPEGVVPDVATRTLRVSYDSLQLSRKNIEFALAAAGFRVLEVVSTPSGFWTNEIPVPPEAAQRLPEECRPSRR